VYGVKASRELVSNITDVVTDEIEIWRNRPVDEVYPIVYIDGIRIKVRDKGAVTIKSAHLVIGVDIDGRKHALGCWIAETEGAKFWHSVLTQLRNRGLRDILIACCDGPAATVSPACPTPSPACSPTPSSKHVSST
jgi:putative transposase